MVACHEVLPYVPAAALVRAQAADVAADDDSCDAPVLQRQLQPRDIDFTRQLSLTGDFADPLLNQELRRFLMRDILSLAVTVLTFIMYMAPVTLVVVDPELYSRGVVIATIMASALQTVTAGLDVAAFCTGDHTAPRASAARYAASIMTAVVTTTFHVLAVFRPYQGVATCKDPAVAATDAPSLGNRGVCFEYISPWTISNVFILVVMRRFYPQHAVPILVVMFIGYALGLVLFHPDPTAETPYDVDIQASTLAANILIAGCAVVVAALYCARFHGLGRDRFIATVEAEHARHQSIAEMREMDSVLQRALPPTVLERMMAAGVEIRDATESATVAVVDIAGLTAYAQFAGQRAAVHALHAFVAVADDAIAGMPGVEKIKTAGDSYCVVSGLPEAFDCHASAACRCGRALVDAAARLSATPPAPPAEDGANSIGEYSADDGDGEAVTVPPTAQEPPAAGPATVGQGGLDGWRGGALRLRVGVHSGNAFGGVLGTQRLSYEVYGGALDGAQVAARHAPPKRISITDAVRRRLAIEAALYAARTDSSSLFASHSDVHDATEQLDDVGSGTIVLYELAASDSGVGTRCGNTLVRARASHADAASVVTHSVVSGFVGNGSDVGQWTAGRMLAQRAGLEQRLEFILRLAQDRETQQQAARRSKPADAYAVQRITAVAAREQDTHGNPLRKPEGTEHGTRRVLRKRRPVDSDSRELTTTTSVGGLTSTASGSRLTGVPTSGSDEATSTEITESTTPSGATTAADAEATKLLAVMEDAVDGPFKRGSRVPLLYSFADEDEERGYIEWVREHTHELRRDMRFASLLLYAVVLGCYAWIGRSEDHSAVAIGCFAVSALLGVANAGLTGTRTAPLADVPLSYATFFFMAAGVIVGNSETRHVITNDVWWLSTAFILFVDTAAVTLNPLARSILDAAVNIATVVPGALAHHPTHEYATFFVVSVLGITTQPYMRYLFDKMLRSAFIETRVAALLRLQQDDARRAREVMLLGLVPPHAVRPLQRWLQAGTPEPLAEEHAAMVVSHVSLRGFTAPASGGEGAGPGLSLLDAHRAVDAILDTCPHLTKVRMSGHSVTLAGPFPPATNSSSDGSTTYTGSNDTQLKPQLSAGDQTRRLGAALCDALRVVAAVGQVGMVVDAGIDVGPVVGAVVGSRRLSYDVHGPCVGTAQRVAESLVGTDSITDLGVNGESLVNVAMTSAACTSAMPEMPASSHAFTLTSSSSHTRTPAVRRMGSGHDLHRVSVSATLAADIDELSATGQRTVRTRRVTSIAAVDALAMSSIRPHQRHCDDTKQE